MVQGWALKPLGDLTEFFSGGTPNKSTPSYWGGEMPWVTVKDMKSMRLNGVGYTLTEEGAKTVRIAPAGSVLILVRGMGLFKDLPVVLCNRPVTFNQDIKALVPKPEINGEFLAYSLLARKQDILKHVDVAGHGTGRLDTDLLKSVALFVPPLPEQQKIAAILKTWDEAIEKTEYILSCRKKYLSVIRQKIATGRKSLKDSGGAWKKVQLKDVLTEHKNLSTGAEEVFSVSVHKGVVNQIEHLGRAYAAKDTSKYNLVGPGDIIYTKSPTGDFPYGIIKQSYAEDKVIVSPLYGVFTPDTFWLGMILDFYFESPLNVSNYLKPLIQKGAKNTINITNQKFLCGSLFLPDDVEEQKELAELINTGRQEVHLLVKKIEILKNQKRGLMQKLLTGEWRVTLDDEQIKEAVNA